MTRLFHPWGVIFFRRVRKYKKMVEKFDLEM